MRYNKSEIMKNAWSYFRTGKYHTFSQALKLSWEDAKVETVEASELNAGDAIKVEYGDYGNLVRCVVAEISKELFLGKYFIVKAIADNVNMEFCVTPNEAVKRFLAVAA